MISVTSFPSRIFLERGVFEQSVNFEFRLQTESSEPMELQEVIVNGFDKEERLLFRLPLNNWGIVPSILIIPDRRLELGKILEIFNPITDFPLDYPIARLRYEFDFRTEKGEHVKPKATVDPIIYEQKAKLNLPCVGTCIVTEGHDSLSHHRRNFPLTHPLIQQIGITGNNSRFAYDFVPVDNEFRILRSAPQRNEDFYCWGEPVFSPGEGKISKMANDLPDNRLDHPPQFDEEAHIKDPTAAMEGHLGNFVVIDHGNDEFSLLAHMQEGSIEVERGTYVTKGKQIGRIGNSGDSATPHLHYQLQDGPGLLKSEGLPSRFHVFELLLGGKTKRVESSCPNTGMILRQE